MNQINYTEKGADLHEHLEALGLPIIERDGAWFALADALATQAAIDAYSVSMAARGRIEHLGLIAERKRDAFLLSAGYLPAERASFAVKLDQARRFVSSGAESDAPTLGVEAGRRGVGVSDLAQRVLNNAAVFQIVEGHIAGAEGAHRDAIRALTTFEEVNSYDINTNWPEL